MIRTIACVAILLVLLTGCGTKQPAASKAVPAKQPAYNPQPQSQPSPTAVPGQVPADKLVQPATPFTTPPQPTPFGTAPGAPGQPATPVSSAFQLAQHQVLETIGVGPGDSFRPEGGEKIVWVRLDVKGTGISPLVVNLTGIKLAADGKNHELRGVGFGGADPSVQHLIDPAIMQSGTVTTSGPAIGEIVYDTGVKQATFQKLPSRMSLMFLVPNAPGSMQIEGLPGGVVKVK